MSRTLAVEAIVLRTVDIGEADRFCILFTKEFGRMAARAKAVRKMTSRLGGTLLPFRCVRLELHQTDHSLTITSAQSMDLVDPSRSYESVLALQQGIELLLALTQDDEPLEDVYVLMRQFVRMSPEIAPSSLVAFQLRLFHLLGILPAVQDDLRFKNLDPASQRCIEQCVKESDLNKLGLMVCTPNTRRFLQSITMDHISAPLRSMSLSH